MTKHGIVASVVLLIVVGVGAGYLISNSDGPIIEEKAITSFEECAAAGYPVMESYPRQCRVQSGELFVEILPGGALEDSPTSTE